MNKDEIVIPPEVARFNWGYFGYEIQWRNPFNTPSVLDIKNIDGELIYRTYIQEMPITIFDIEKHLKNGYFVEVKNIMSGKIKLYNVI